MSMSLVQRLAVAIIALPVGLAVGQQSCNGNPPPHSTTTTAAAAPTGVPIGINTNYWQPAAGSSWQIELENPFTVNAANTKGFQIVDIDLFDNSQKTIASLHALGIRVICYFSAGTFENWRPDESEFNNSDKGLPVGGWPGEWWLNTSSPNVRSIMAARINLAAQKGCDGVDPDNTDGYENDTGFNLSMAEATNYVEFLAQAAHSRNLSIGLKNTGDIVGQVLPLMQWAIDEECEVYDECNIFQPFIAEGKPVFHIEYPASAPQVSQHQKNLICNYATAQGFSTIMKDMNLDYWRLSC